MFWYFVEKAEIRNFINMFEEQCNARLGFISNAHFYCYYDPH